MTGKLHVVGTPIGDLSDFSPRAAQTLAEADFIAAEDTRVTVKPLNHLGIKKPMVSHFEYNKLERGGVITRRILAGKTYALVSDAGMPAISDPGELLVAQCAELGIQALVVPGPSVVISALAISSLPTGHFTFEGFLSVNKRARHERLQQVAAETRTMVFYEAPHKPSAILADMLAAWGDRRIALVRELAKIHEEVVRTTLSEAVRRYSEESPRGEFALVTEGAPVPAEGLLTLEEAIELARTFLEGGASVSESAKRATKESGHSKAEIYKKTCEWFSIFYLIPL